MENNFKKIADECLGKQEKFEEEFEDELNCILKLDRLVKKYLKWYSKVKISAKKGKIVIERIEE